MAKNKTAFFCSSCGFEAAKWLGRCTACGTWNSFTEEIISTDKKPSWTKDNGARSVTKPVLIQEVNDVAQQRIVFQDKELNRVLGGGLVPGSLVLLGGEPGIGKSTLLLQLAVQANLKVVYVSGEESEQQIKMRAERIGIKNTTCYLLTETNTQNILLQVQNILPDILIIDSIQTIYTNNIESSPGTVSQVRECAAELMRYAKETNTPTFIIGHITKDGVIAGPKILEHIVDCVLQFEGDNNHIYRIVRAIKNRFGATSELGIYEMKSTGLIEVSNPSDVLISKIQEAFSGIAISVMVEGSRPLLIESQALVSTAVYGTPQRSATGFDSKRMNMLLAVIEKRCGFKIGAKDVFLNITGGIKVVDPAIDLGVICAILSSNLDKAIPNTTCFAGEVGLSGEIRPVNRIEQRIAEAERLGMKHIYISAYNEKGLKDAKFKIKIHTCKKIENVYYELFGSE